MKLKKISGLFSTVPTVLNTVPKQPYTFKGKVTRLDAPIGAGVPVILHDRVTGVCIETTETDADSFVVFQNLDKTKSYYIVAIDAENLFQSIVYDLTWQTSNNFEYNPKLQYTDKLAQSSLKDFYNYYQQESLLESDALVFSISSPSVYDDNVLTWNASGSLVTDIIDDYPSFIFNASSRYLYLETTPTYAQQPFTFETFFQIDNLKASNTHYLFTQISTGSLRHSFYIDNQGYLIFSRDYSPVISIRSLSKIKDGWNHAALTFDGTNLYLFLNGKLESTNSDAIGLQGFQNHFGIGYLLSGAMAYTSWKHSCEYLTDFQPKTQSYSKKQFKDINDVFDSSVVLKTEARSNSVQSLMVDKAKHMPFTVGATHLVQSNSAVSINNSFSRSTVMSSDYVLKGDFCIELTYSLNSTATYPTLFSNQSVTSEWIANNWALTVSHSSSRNKYAIYRANLTTLVSTYPMLLREITTIAIDKQGTTVRVFFNGFLVDTFTNVPAFDTRLNSYIAFGRDISYTLYDAKLTNGVSRYQSDYTPTWLSTWTDQNLAAEQHMLLNLSFKTSLVNFSTRLQAVLNDVSLSSTMSVNGTKSAFFKEAQLLLNSDFYVPHEMFTLELRVYLSEQQEDFKTIVQLYRDDSNILRIGFNANRQLCYILAEDEVVTLEDVVFKDNFDHLVIQRQGSTFKILLEGELVATIPFSLVLAYVSLSVMSNFDRTDAAEGYVNNLYLYKNYLKYSDSYEVPYEEIVQDAEEKEPEVVVTSYTTSALNFENGLIDQVGTTVWQKEGTADITYTNKIFGDNSFETKALGDSLSTTSNIITGGATPFTIEFYALISKQHGWTGAGYTQAPLFSKNGSSSSTNQQVHVNFAIGGKIQLERQANTGATLSSTGSININYNEINKYTISYDGASYRFFINDKLDHSLGTSNALNMSMNRPFTFLDTLVPSYPQFRTGTKGLIDNINIYDGIATKVRDYDPYEEYLVVDLAFDGENNSTKIVDNARLNELNEIKYNDNVVSLLQFDDNISDEVGNRTWSITGSSYSFIDGKFSKALEITGENNIIQSDNITEAEKLSNSQNFTVEYWVKLNSDTDGTIFSRGKNGNTLSYSNSISLTGVRWIQYRNGSGSSGESVSAPYNFSIDEWYHIAIVGYTDYNREIFINGESIVKRQISSSWYTSSNDPLRIGSLDYLPSYAYWFKGSICGFRITNGVARYTENFTPPTEPFKYIPKNNWTVNGNAIISTDQKFDGFSSLKVMRGYNELPFIKSNINLSQIFSNNFSIDCKFILTSALSANEDAAIIESMEANKKAFSFGLSDINGGLHRVYFLYSTDGVNTTRVSFNIVPYFSLNKEYRINFTRTDTGFLLYINGLFIEKINHNVPTKVFDSELVKIVPYNNSARGITGYIGHFKIYKDVAVIPESPLGKIQLDFDNNVIDKYGNSTWTNNGVTFDQVNSVKGHAAYFNGNDSTYLFLSQNNNLNFENYNFEISMDFKSNTTRQYDMLLASNHTSYNNNETFQFSHGMYSGLFFRFGNKDIDVVSNINPLNNQYYSTSIRRYNDTFSLELNDVLIGQCNSALPLNITNGGGTRLGGIGWGSGYNYNGYIDNFKSIKNLQEPVIIDKPAVHLPLETNATNIGFSQLTINSVGSPTYHVVDGKKCIRFESGKYLTINSNNIFNLGTNSDFYIETDIFLHSFKSITSVHNILSNVVNWNDIRLNSIYINTNYNSSLAGIVGLSYYDGVKMNFLYSENKIQLNTWNNLKITRKDKSITIELNEIQKQYILDQSIDFSLNGTQVGRGENQDVAGLEGYMSNFKMFVGTSEIPETYNDKKVLDLDFKPTGKSYLFKDNNNKCIIHPVNITQRDYQNSQYCCTFNGVDQYLQLGKNDLLNFGLDDFVIEIALDVRYLYGQENRFCRLLAPPRGTTLDEYIMFVGEDHPIADMNILGGISFVLKEGESPPLRTGRLAEGYNVVTITRSNNLFSIYANGVLKATANWANEVNFNRNDNTTIGGQFNTIKNDIESPYKGTIYSIKVLRNTSDLSLLKDKQPPVETVVPDYRGLWVNSLAVWNSSIQNSPSNYMNYDPFGSNLTSQEVLFDNTRSFLANNFKKSNVGPVLAETSEEFLIDINPLNKVYRLSALAGTWNATYLKADFEFLDSNDNIIMVMRVESDSTFYHSIWCGAAWTGLVKKATNVVYTELLITLDSNIGLVARTLNTNSSYASDFSFTVSNFESIAKLKIKNLKAYMDYTGGSGHAAYVLLYMLKDLSLRAGMQPLVDVGYPVFTACDLGTQALRWTRGGLTATPDAKGFKGILSNTSITPVSMFYTQAFTIDFTVAGYGNIFKKWATNLRYSLNLSNTGILTYTFYTSNSGQKIFTFNLGAQVVDPTRLTLTRKEDGTLCLWVDGVLQTTSHSILSSYTYYADVNEPMDIGDSTLELYSLKVFDSSIGYIENLN